MCRARLVPSEVGVRGVSPPAFTRRACVGMAGAQQATSTFAAVGVDASLLAQQRLDKAREDEHDAVAECEHA